MTLALLISLSVANKLFFDQNGEFKILQLSDLHYGESHERDTENDAIQRELIKLTTPDFIALTGDALSGHKWEKRGKKSDYFQSNWARWTEPYLYHKVKYAFLLGNHDTEANFNGR